MAAVAADADAATSAAGADADADSGATRTALARRVAAAFAARFGGAGAVLRHIAIAPGRVNLIGEHIDYEGFAVLPMALEHACCVAVGATTSSSGSSGADGSGAATSSGGRGGESAHHGGRLRWVIANVDAAAYPEAVFDSPPAPAAPTPASAGSAQHEPLSPWPPPPPAVAACSGWQRYVLAAAHGVWEHLGGGGRAGGDCDHDGGGGNGATLCVMVGSAIPPRAGLSSSSALVVASALALLAWRGAAAGTDATTVADLCRRCERLVGTMGGGMDQAVSLLAAPGRAALIDWAPLRVAPVRLPRGAAFVVADCLAASAKAETADLR